MEDFLNIINHYKDKIQLLKSKNLDFDPYFKERQAELSQIRNDLKNGKMELLSKVDYNQEIKQFFTNLK